ncbi:unnamed protein product [Camellia sinensis]
MITLSPFSNSFYVPVKIYSQALFVFLLQEGQAVCSAVDVMQTIGILHLFYTLTGEALLASTAAMQ